MAVVGLSRRTAVVFPGQGSQTVGMGEDLAAGNAEIAELFAEANEIVGFDLRSVMRDGPDSALQETRVSQPAIFVTNIALAIAAGKALEPVAAAGHSFGEFCALTLAGSLKFSDALRLVNQRAQAMGRAADKMPGTMSAVLGLNADRLREIVEEVRAEPGTRVRLANFNAPLQIVVSGDRRGVERVGTLAVAAGAKRVVPLNVSGAWHSELMEPAQAEFREFVEVTEITVPRFAVISNFDAKPYTDVATIRHHLVASVTDEVRWHDTALALLTYEPNLVVEFGASRVLTPLIGRLPGAPEAIHVGSAKNIAALVQTLSEAAT